MKILVAGATGAIGTQLVPRLVERGHEVIAMTRSADKRDAIERLGASPAVADALDPEHVADVVAAATPEVIVHELTALSGPFDMRHFDRTFALTNRLRTEATDHLLSAGRAVGIKRFVAQSYAGWTFERSGPPVKTEEDALDPHPAAAMRRTFEAIAYLERTVTEAGFTEGIVLRYGGLYGPGTSLSKDGEHAELIHKRKFPIVGGGSGVWSFVHVADAADATVLAVERGTRGIYNIVDDEPAPVADWLPALASSLGAPKPMRVPRVLGRLLGGEAAAVMMTEARGASNAKAKRTLGWQPGHPSWRQGFPEAVA
jgi:nucleoside-diphosphate-sugar epimerase